MTVGDMFNWTGTVVNNYQSGSFSPDQFNQACQVVAIELFNTKCGLPEQWKPGSPFSSQQYGINEKNIDDLSPFINHHLPIAKNTAGYFPKPANYYAFSSLSFDYVVNSEDCKGQPTSTQRFIQLVNDGEWRIRIGNSIIYPSSEYPLAKLSNSGFQVAPKNINNVYLTYLQAPVPPVFGFTITNDEAIYNPGTSTQCDFPETLHTEFCIRIVRWIAVNLRDTELQKWAIERLSAGQ